MIYLLNPKKIIVGVFDNSTPMACPYFNDSHVENIETGVHNYEFSFPADHTINNDVESNGYVIIKDLDGLLQMFQIKEIEEDGDVDSYNKRLYCEHIAISELIGKPLRPIELKSTSLDNAMENILSGSGWVLGLCEYEASDDVIIEDYTNVLEGIYKIMEIFDAEIRFEAVIKNGVVFQQKVHVVQKRGTVTNKFFSYGKDLVDVTRKENSEGLVTALIGVGKGDSNSSRITLNNYSVTAPTGYEKPLSADWIGNEAALQRFSNDGEHIFGIFMDDVSTNQASLYTRTLAELKKRMIPQLTFSMGVAVLERITGWDAEEVRVGDTVIIKDETFVPVLALDARVKEIKRSYTNPENDAIVLGDYRPIKLATVANLAKIQAKIAKDETQWNTTAYKVEITSTNGLMFRSGTIDTVLEARVYKGATDVTDTIDANYFHWVRVSKDTAADVAWNNTHFGGTKTVTITPEDIYQRATFNCSVDIL